MILRLILRLSNYNTKLESHNHYMTMILKLPFLLDVNLIKHIVIFISSFVKNLLIQYVIKKNN